VRHDDTGALFQDLPHQGDRTHPRPRYDGAGASF